MIAVLAIPTLEATSLFVSRKNTRDSLSRAPKILCSALGSTFDDRTLAMNHLPGTWRANPG
jgi:hypothetical protein